MKPIDTLEPGFKDKIVGLLATLDAMGIKCIVTSGRRTLSEQHKLYQQGRTTPGQIVTKADSGQSPHNFGLAADLCPINPKTKDLWWDCPDDIWQVIHNVAEGTGMVPSPEANEFNLDSGYDWKFCDRPHVEDPSWREVQAAWREGKVQVA